MLDQIAKIENDELYNAKGEKIGRVTQNFGRTEFAQTSGIYKNQFHSGLDVVLHDPNLTSPVSGKVIEKKEDPEEGYGYSVTIQRPDGYRVRISHLKNNSPLNVGDTVNAGQFVGIMGSTGVSTGAHVDFEYRDPDNKPVNPKEFFKQPITERAGAAVQQTTRGILDLFRDALPDRLKDKADAFLNRREGSQGRQAPQQQRANNMSFQDMFIQAATQSGIEASKAQAYLAKRGSPGSSTSRSGNYNRNAIQSVIDEYTDGKAPVTADDFISVSQQYGVPVDLMLAQAIQESHIGTRGKRPISTKNIFNVGNVDSGANEAQKNWRAGMERYASTMKDLYTNPQGVVDTDDLISRDFQGKIGRYATDPNYTRSISKLVNQIRPKIG